MGRGLTAPPRIEERLGVICGSLMDLSLIWAPLIAQLVKNLSAMQETPGSISGLGRSPGEGMGYPLQYSGLENSMDCIVHGVAKSWTRLSGSHFTYGSLLFLGAQPGPCSGEYSSLGVSGEDGTAELLSPWGASDVAPKGAMSLSGATSPKGSVSGRRGQCSVPAVPSRTRFECASSPLSFPQACSIRDPNSGYVFDLNPLNKSQGYVVSGIGKMFLVRLAGCTLICLRRMGGGVELTLIS